MYLPTVVSYRVCPEDTKQVIQTVISLFLSWKYFRMALVDRKFVTLILFHYETFLHRKMFLFGYLERKQTRGANSQRCEVELKSAAVYLCSALVMEAYRDPARCSYPLSLHPFLSINAHCAPARVSEIFSYKLEIFLDGYASPKFIPHEIILTKIYANENPPNYGILHL